MATESQIKTIYKIMKSEKYHEGHAGEEEDSCYSVLFIYI